MKFIPGKTLDASVLQFHIQLITFVEKLVLH